MRLGSSCATIARCRPTPLGELVLRVFGLLTPSRLRRAIGFVRLCS